MSLGHFSNLLWAPAAAAGKEPFIFTSVLHSEIQLQKAVDPQLQTKMEQWEQLCNRNVYDQLSQHHNSDVNNVT